MSVATGEITLEDLLNSDTEGDDSKVVHLACGCFPQLELCGRYVPWTSGVELVPTPANVCTGCSQTWNNGGCPRCSCGPGAICQACYTSAAQEE